MAEREEEVAVDQRPRLKRAAARGGLRLMRIAAIAALAFLLTSFDSVPRARGAGAPAHPPLESVAAPSDPLGSWNDGASKRAILEFVRQTTAPASPRYLPPGRRVVTFDQDGTLWVEQPLDVEAMFALDRVRALGAGHPEWKKVPALRAVLDGDSAKVAAFGAQDWEHVIAVTHAGMTTDEFATAVKQWLVTARHPRFNRPYTDLAYQPMRELLGFLRASGFRTYIVSGSGQDFVRVYSEEVYGVPPEQVIGSTMAKRYEYEDGKPVLMRLPDELFVDDNAGKAISIDLFIGARPDAAFGNSAGDREMLEWTGSGGGARLEMLVLHDDPLREYAYGPADGLPATRVGAFPEWLMAEAKYRGWTVISMRNDWRRIFAFE